jgi:hypothetical protein
MSVGFERSTAALNMLKVKFDVMPALRASVGYGGTQALFGFEVVPFRREVAGLFTEFKLLTDFLTAANFGYTTGTMRFQLAVGIGF